MDIQDKTVASSTPALPPDAPMLLAELKRQQLPEKAVEHLRAYAKFYLWAMPLFDLGHVTIHRRAIEFSSMVSKRFKVGLAADGLPRMEVQSPEMAWMSVIPWAYAGIHYKSGRIVLIARPEKPLSSSGFIIPVDLPEKILPFKDKRYINIVETSMFELSGNHRICLELKELEDGFFTKKKHKNKL